MDVPFRAGSPVRRPRRLRRSQALVAALALALPAAQTAHAVEIYYARAIGQEYLPEAEPSQPARTPDRENALPDLPGLGAREGQPQAPDQGMSTWSKVLIGTVLVAAIAAIANNGGGGSAGVSVGTGGNPAPDPGTADGGSSPGEDSGGVNEPAPGTGGGGGGDGGGGIDIGIIPVGEDNGGGRGRGRDRDRGDDDDDD